MMEWLSRLWDALLKDYGSRLNIEYWANFAQHLIDSLAILGLAILSVWIAKLLTRRAARVGRLGSPLARRRIETVASLVYSIAKYVVYISCGLWVLTVWGVNTQSLVVGSAVIGAAIGFGSQGLVQDIIVGLSILAEEQLAVGEYVEISGRSGAVEEVGLRVVKLRDPMGVQHVIFNRTIGMVSNYGGCAIEAILDVAVESADQADRARALVLHAGMELAFELPYFVGAPNFVGLMESSVGDRFVRFRLRVLPQRDSAINEHLVPRIRKAFAGAGLKIPDDQIRVVVISDRFRQVIGRLDLPTHAPMPGVK